jgi:hypothetical protein
MSQRKPGSREVGQNQHASDAHEIRGAGAENRLAPFDVEQPSAVLDFTLAGSALCRPPGKSVAQSSYGSGAGPPGFALGRG